MAANAIQEQDGSTSMRRVLAACCAASGVGLFVLSGAKESKYAFYGGLACLGAMVLMLFFTTAGDIVEALRVWKTSLKVGG